MNRRITITKISQIKEALALAQRGDIIFVDERENSTDEIKIEECEIKAK